jgi:hypothetical protein
VNGHQYPEITWIYKMGDGVCVVSSFNHTEQTGTFFYFKTLEEAKNFIHNNSLKQFPKWHEENCDCKGTPR